MLSKITKKRIEQFKTDFPDHKISAKGNLYYSHGEYMVARGFVYSIYNVTKGIIDKMGENKNWNEKYHEWIFLLTPKGKMMIRPKNKTTFRLCGIRDVSKYPEIANVFFIGRKYEYLKNFPKLYHYKFFQGFNSLKEAKIFLGFGFMSDEDFYDFIPHSNRHDDSNQDIVLELMMTTKDHNQKRNLVSLVSNTTNRNMVFTNLYDYVRMAKTINHEYTIPAGANKLRKLHDEMVDEYNKGRILQYSDEVVYKIKSLREDNRTFEDDWKEIGIDFLPLNSPRKLYKEGVKQKHCIGTYGKTLHTQTHYRITFDGLWYDIQIEKEGRIRQFYGYRNCLPPKELNDLIRFSGIDYKHEIVNLDGSPIDRHSGLTVNPMAGVAVDNLIINDLPMLIAGGGTVADNEPNEMWGYDDIF